MNRTKAWSALVGSLCVTGSHADPAISTACSVELARWKYPHTYLVAQVDNAGEPRCDEVLCVIELAVRQVLATGDASARPSSIAVRNSVRMRDDGSGFPKGQSVGVFVPDDSTPGSFNYLSVAFPAPAVLAEFEQAVTEAASMSSGTTHCSKASRATARHP